MPIYDYFNLRIACSVPLPELQMCRGTEHDCTIQADASPSASTPARWFHHWRNADGSVYAGCAHVSDGFRLRFPGTADFFISFNGGTIRYTLAPNTSIDALRHLLLHQVLPRALSHRGKLVLHASVIQVSEKTIAFLGDSGWGKSTLAASFAADDADVLSDDCLVLDEEEQQVNALVGFPGLRLWSDSALLLAKQPGLINIDGCSASKRQLLLKDIQHESLSNRRLLSRLFVLDRSAGKDIYITPMSRRDALIALTKHSFRLDVSDKVKSAEDFLRLSSVVESVPVFQLGYPRDYRFLPAVHEAIRNNLEFVAQPGGKLKERGAYE